MTDFDIDAAQQLCDNAKYDDADWLRDRLSDALTEIRRLRAQVGKPLLEMEEVPPNC